MDRRLFSYIWRYSKRDQLFILVVTAISYPFYYYSLDLPKTIINKAVSGTGFPKDIQLFSLFDYNIFFNINHYP